MKDILGSAKIERLASIHIFKYIHFLCIGASNNAMSSYISSKLLIFFELKFIFSPYVKIFIVLIFYIVKIKLAKHFNIELSYC